MKKSIILFSSLTILLFTLFPAAHSFAKNDYGLKKTSAEAGLTISDKPEVIIGNLIGTTLSIIGVIFFILMVYAGFKWMTARGNEEGVKEAQKTIIAAIIGLVVVLSAYAITNFVFTSVDEKKNNQDNGTQ